MGGVGGGQLDLGDGTGGLPEVGDHQLDGVAPLVDGADTQRTLAPVRDRDHREAHGLVRVEVEPGRGVLTQPRCDDVAGSEQADAPLDCDLPVGTIGALGVHPLVEGRVLDDVAALAPDLLVDHREPLAVADQAPLERDDGPIGLELGKRLSQEGHGLGLLVPADQVGGHVVGGPERRRERELAAAGEAGDLGERHERRPQHDGEPLVVDAAAAGPAGELGELRRGEELVGVAVVLGQLLDDHTAGRHVDAERQRLGGEHHLDQALDEAALDGFLERRDQAGVVRRDALLERGGPHVVAEDVQIGVAQHRDRALENLSDPDAFVGIGEPQPAVAGDRERVVAGVAAEDEVDDREQVFLGEPLDRLEPPRRDEPATAIPRRPRGPPASTAGVAIEPVALGVGATVDQNGDEVVAIGGRVADEVQVLEFDGTLVLDDRRGRAPDRLDPLPQLTGVRHRRRQADEPHVGREADDDLLPDRAPVGVLQVVHLVEDHHVQVVEGGRPRIEHVAEHLGGHHHNGRVAVDCGVTGEQSHPLGAQPGDEIAVLLVRERLDGRGVEGLATGVEGDVDRRIGDDRLARTRRCSDQDGAAGVELGDRLELETVEREGNGIRRRHGHAAVSVASRFLARRPSMRRATQIDAS